MRSPSQWPSSLRRCALVGRWWIGVRFGIAGSRRPVRRRRPRLALRWASWRGSPARRPAALFMILILIGVFPANLHMALNPEAFPDIPAWALYVRLPLQGLLIWWAWVVSRYEQ